MITREKAIIGRVVFWLTGPCDSKKSCPLCQGSGKVRAFYTNPITNKAIVDVVKCCYPGDNQYGHCSDGKIRSKLPNEVHILYGPIIGVVDYDLEGKKTFKVILANGCPPRVNRENDPTNLYCTKEEVEKVQQTVLSDLLAKIPPEELTRLVEYSDVGIFEVTKQRDELLKKVKSLEEDRTYWIKKSEESKAAMEELKELRDKINSVLR